MLQVTALGSASGDAAGAAKAVVNYLDGRATARGGTSAAPVPELPTPNATTGLVGYYADSVEGPGKWLGRGMTGMRLEGEVDPEAFERVLMGQHAATGEQLVGARGSAARADEAGRDGVAVAATGDPDEVLTLPQAATLLGVSDRYLRRVATETAELREAQAKATEAGETPPDTPATYLVARHEADNKRWAVARGEVDRFAAERKTPTAVVGYDLTFSVPKSVSILWARSDPAHQAEIVAAMEAAVGVGMAYIERNAAWVGRGNTRRHAEGLVAAAYVHATSRALDPQLHCHAVVANMAESPGGPVVALDGRPLYAHAKTARYLAAAELRHQLSTRLGVAWEGVERGVADVAGVGGAAIAEMSQRSNQIDELVAKWGLGSPAARKAAAYLTRPAKDHAVDPEALRPMWNERLDAVGFGARAAGRCYGQQAAPLLVTDEDRTKLFERLGGERGVTEMASTFDRRDVIQYVAEWAGDRLDAAGIADLADEWLTSEVVVSLDAARREGRTADVIRLGNGAVVSAVGDDALYTTRQVLHIEQGLFAGYEAGRHAGAAVVSSQGVEAVLADRTKLGDDQVDMVRAITRSGHRIQCVLGPAGAGKTTALEAAARAWEAEGYRPIGTAVQGTHAELLGAKAGIESRTVASLLMGTRTGSVTVDTRSVIVVDECSTLGNRDLLELTNLVNERGAALRLIGDPAQHGAVAAGGGWRRLLEDYAGDRGEVHERRRQQGDEMADVVAALDSYAEGDISAAIDTLAASGRVVEADSPEEIMDALVTDWYHDRQRRLGDPSLAVSTMTADHHIERRELNRRARALLIADGTLTGPSLDLAGVSFRTGDEIIALQGDRTLRAAGSSYRDHVKTGERGTVVGVRLDKELSKSALVVDFERRGRVDVGYSHLTHRVRPGVVGRLAHSYALTTYAAQGETYEAGRGLATEQAMRAGVYVALSRGRSDAKLYMLRRRDLVPGADEHPQMPRLEPQSAILAEVTARLEAQHAEQLATEVDADAPEVARLRRAHSLDELTALAVPPNPGAALARRALVDELGVIATRAHLHPDPALLARIGPRPADGYHRDIWDAAVGEVATFGARWGADTVAGGTGATWALGPQRSGPAGEHYATAAALLRRAEAAFLAERPTGELARQRAELVALLGAPVVSPAAPAPDLGDAAQAADALAAAVATQRSAERRLERLNDRRPRRRNPQSIELASQDLAGAELAVARAQAGFDAAVHLQAAGAGDGEANRDAVERLATIDTALDMQATRVIEAPAPYLEAVLGPRPEAQGQRRAWEAGALAVERYRHVHLGATPEAGTSPVAGGGPVVAVVGRRPEGPGAVAYDEMVDEIVAARTGLLLGELHRRAPEAPVASALGHALADRGLHSLVDEVERSRLADALHVGAKRAVGDATIRLDNAEDALARASAAADQPGRRFGRRAAAEATAAADKVASAQGDVDYRRAELAAARSYLADTPAVPAGHGEALAEAVELRKALVRGEALRNPPAWLRDDVSARVAKHPPGDKQLDPARLARAYGDVATYAEQAGLDDVESLDEILAPFPATDELAHDRHIAIDELHIAAAPVVETGIDLSL